MSSTPHKKNVVENSAFQAEGSIHIGDITYNFNDKEVKIPHLLTNNIPSNADHILGRDTELQTISTHLAQNKPTVLVNGIGGIGKTSVAAKYVATFGNQYTHLAWLTVQSSVAEAFTNDLVLLKSLHIEQDVRQLIETQRLTDAFKLVVKKLNDLNKTLVVLDNANNPDDLITHKNLFDTAKCHYLITSRTQPQEWTIVEIDHLPPDEAIKLFQNLAPSVLASKEDLKGLLSKLFYHTLLIELVAKAANKSKISFITLENIVNEKFIHDTKLNKHAIKTGVSGSFENSFKRANVQKYIWFIFQSITSIPDKSKELLRAFALLPIATSFEEDFLEKHFQLLDLEECVIDILDDLVESGWLNEAVDKEKTAYKMHPLITDVVVKHLDINANYADKYINHVAELILFDNAEPSHILHEKKKNEPLAERLVDLFFNENTEGVSMLLHWLSWLKKQLGFFKSALKLSKRALQIAQNLTHIDEVSLFERQAVLGQIYKSLGNYPKATDLLSDVLEQALERLGQKHPNIAIFQNNLAKVYGEIGRYDEAILLLEQAIESDLDNFGKFHPKLAIRQSSLATIYNEIGRYEEAAILLEQALESDFKNFGKNHKKIAVRQYNLAKVYRKLARQLDAINLLNMALINIEMNLGLEHPISASCHFDLAFIYQDLGDKPQSSTLFQKSYQIRLKALGEDHPDTQKTKKILTQDLLFNGGIK